MTSDSDTDPTLPASWKFRTYGSENELQIEDIAYIQSEGKIGKHSERKNDQALDTETVHLKQRRSHLRRNLNLRKSPFFPV